MVRVAAGSPPAPQPQDMARDEAPTKATPIKKTPHGPGGPTSKCQTWAEAEEWAMEWDERYTAVPHDDELYLSLIHI